MTSLTRNACLAMFLAAATLTGVTACAPTGTRQSAGEMIDDATLTARVKTAFAKDEVVKAREINIETFRGVVQLSGFVDSRAVADRAERLAKSVPGVVSVKNDLRVKPPA